jgi:hypothetical protein
MRLMVHIHDKHGTFVEMSTVNVQDPVAAASDASEANAHRLQQRRRRGPWCTQTSMMWSTLFQKRGVGSNRSG